MDSRREFWEHYAWYTVSGRGTPPIIPEPEIIERVVEVEKPVAKEFLIPQTIFVGQTESCYAYHTRYSQKCNTLKDLVQRGVSVKRFTPCTNCFPKSKPGSKRE